MTELVKLCIGNKIPMLYFDKTTPRFMNNFSANILIRNKVDTKLC